MLDPGTEEYKIMIEGTFRITGQKLLFVLEFIFSGYLGFTDGVT